MMATQFSKISTCSLCGKKSRYGMGLVNLVTLGGVAGFVMSIFCSVDRQTQAFDSLRFALHMSGVIFIIGCVFASAKLQPVGGNEKESKSTIPFVLLIVFLAGLVSSCRNF